MVKNNVNKNVNHISKKSAGSWPEALQDAEQKLEAANREVADWKAVVAICKRNVKNGEPWPTTTAQAQ
jgi:hypothetical protein